jgi:eukaryotic-like serine/threonine-protein kinase
MEERCGIWRLDRILAVGGIAEVWQASAPDDSEPRAVAVKRLHSHLLRHDQVRSMFERECNLALGLPAHPAVVHGIDRGEANGRPWLAMRRADGIDLRRHLDGEVAPSARSGAPDGSAGGAKARVLPAPVAVQLVARACEAVAHLHDHGWVHGDVSPANLMVDDALEKLVLCDLGVARAVGEGGPVQGTHAYMAPEQVRAEPWSTATDVFALGVLLWELVQGRRLFHRGPSWLTMQAILENEVPPLPNRELQAIADQALARAPTERITDPRALARRLEAWGFSYTRTQ